MHKRYRTIILQLHHGPSWVSPMRCADLQCTAAELMQHSGSATIDADDIPNTPIHILAEQEGVPVSVAVATDSQISLFAAGARLARRRRAAQHGRLPAVGYPGARGHGEWDWFTQRGRRRRRRALAALTQSDSIREICFCLVKK